jgi:hypothetical protein
VTNKTINSYRLLFFTTFTFYLPCLDLTLPLVAEEARRVGVVCKNLHVAQPEVGINISLSDESDIIEYSVFC